MFSGLAFVHPLIAAGTALALLPILIHWLSRRQYRLVAWAAMRFLLEAEKENRRRVRFEQWLLVILRCLAIGLIALIFARPFVRPGALSALLGQQAAAQRIVVLDDSASLSFRGDQGTEFDQLKHSLRRLCTWLAAERAGERFQVFVTSRPDAPIVSEPSLSSATLGHCLEAINEVHQTHARANPGRVLRTVATQVSQGAPTRTELCILSDFQRNEWVDAGADGPFADLTRVDASLLRLVLIRSASDQRENVAIADLRLERPQTIVGLPAVARVRVANNSHAALHDLAVRVEIDGAAQPPAIVSEVAPGESAEAMFEATFADEGFHELSVELPQPDLFAVDNSRGLVAFAAPALPVLLVNGHPAVEAAQDGARLLRAALAPPGPFVSGLAVDVVDAAGLETADLSRYAVVAASNLAVPSELQAAALRRFVESGGGLILLLGSETEPDEYNRILGAAGAGLLPAALESVRRGVGPSDGVGLIRVGDHPITAMFPGDAAALSESTRFNTFVRIVEESAASQPAATQPTSTQPAGPATVLARFTDDRHSPALLERSLGRGRVLLFASSVDLAWNNWARSTDGSFVVSMLEMMQYSARRTNASTGFLAGDLLRVSVDPERYETSAIFRSARDPATSAATATERQSGAFYELIGPPAWTCGAYHAELKRRDGALETRPLIANLDPRESDLTVARPEEIDPLLGALRHEWLTADQSLTADQEARQEFWPTLMVIVLMLLFGEQFLAWRLGLPRGLRSRSSP